MSAVYQVTELRIFEEDQLKQLSLTDSPYTPVVRRTTRLIIVKDTDELMEKLSVPDFTLGDITQLLNEADMVAVDGVLSSLTQANLDTHERWLALSTWLRLNHPDLTEEQLTALRDILEPNDNCQETEPNR